MSKSEYINGYIRDHYDRLTLNFPKGEKEKIKSRAKEKSMTVSQYISYLVNKGNTKTIEDLEKLTLSKSRLYINEYDHLITSMALCFLREGNMEKVEQVLFEWDDECQNIIKKDFCKKVEWINNIKIEL